MKTWMKVGLGVASALIVFAGFVATRPGTYHVERSTVVGATAAVVYDQLDDYASFVQWSPWEKLDPSMKKTFDGPSQGVGASYTWAGNDKVGKGKMTIVAADGKGLVEERLEFIEPFASVAQTTFRLSPDGAGTRVTWSMDGTNNFVSKLFGLFMNMDKMIGKDFEAGLASLKTLAESRAKAPPAP
jgi:hypothetical protein